MPVKTEKEFPDKLPGPDYKMEIDWFFFPSLILGHLFGIYGLWTIEKPLLTCIYGKRKLKAFDEIVKAICNFYGKNPFNQFW
jgi:hypothetical protein